MPARFNLMHGLASHRLRRTPAPRVELRSAELSTHVVSEASHTRERLEPAQAKHLVGDLPNFEETFTMTPNPTRRELP